MRKSLVSLMLLASMLGAPVAMAAETAHGTIQKLDSKACTVTLNGDKAAFHLMPKCDFSQLKVGEKVSISWTAAGNVRLVSTIQAG